jgi:hypothetical protein
MNQTETDEKLENVDLEALMKAPLEELAEPAKKHKRRKFRKYATPNCTPAQKEALWRHQGGI